MTTPTKLVKLNPEFITLLGEEKPIENPFVGYVELEVPAYIERMNLSTKISEMNKKGDEGKLESIKFIIEEVKKRTKSVNLKYEDEEETITNIDDLSYSEEGAGLINELGGILTKGQRLGKKKK